MYLIFACNFGLPVFLLKGEKLKKTEGILYSELMIYKII